MGTTALRCKHRLDRNHTASPRAIHCAAQMMPGAPDLPRTLDDRQKRNGPLTSYAFLDPEDLIPIIVLANVRLADGNHLVPDVEQNPAIRVSDHWASARLCPGRSAPLCCMPTFAILERERLARAFDDSLAILILDLKVVLDVI
jgi:hypothetical protein